MRYRVGGYIWWRPVLMALSRLCGLVLLIVFAAVVAACLIALGISMLKTF